VSADPDVVAAWDAVHDALARLPGWEASRPAYRVEERLWIATAHYIGWIRVLQRRPVVEARGATEADALRELAEALRPATKP
jgi:hypothetical protein